MRLILSKTIVQKIEYFSRYFNSKEWSGPAWYKVTGKKGMFPEKFELKHFHPLDLGSHAATEIDSKEVAKILVPTYKAHPHLKDCYMGLVHSHHSMGAFFSGTDTGTLEDMAPQTGFYPSLVVATAKEPYAFAVSYQDQYGNPQYVECEEIHVPAEKGNPKWEEQCKELEDNAKPKGKVFYGANGQTQLGLPYGKEVEKKELTEEQQAHIEACFEKYNAREMTYFEFKAECDKLGVDPYESAAFGGYGGYGYGRW